MMGGIDISTLTLEQYFRMIDENHAPGMVNEEFGRTMEKDIKDMTIAEYMKYEEELTEDHGKDSSHFLLQTIEQGIIDNTDAPNLKPHDEGMRSDDDVDEWFVTEMEEHTKRRENKEDAMINIMKSLVEECKTFYKSKQIKTSETNTVLEASSMISNET
ncbi:hypothetical protein Tco_1575369 [Tanacetum coccineum]